MPLLLVIGGVLILFGLALFVAWFGYFWQVFKAFLPLFIIALGGLLTYFGWEERKDTKRAFIDFSSPDEASRYQADALAYQEKIDNLTNTDTQNTIEETTLLVEHTETVDQAEDSKNFIDLDKSKK
jgi:divalent metal cation (Fe/Co/Zn/Cd) transporter